MNKMFFGLLCCSLVTASALGQNSSDSLPESSTEDDGYFARDVDDGDVVADGSPREDISGEAENSLVPPKLTQYIEAEYPKDAFAQGLEVDLIAKLEIDATGKVVDVQIEETVGHGFDEAATEAMRQFQFSPATQDGKPVSCFLMYKYRFFIDENSAKTSSADAPASNNSGEKVIGEAPPLAALSGVVKDFEDQPLAGVYVSLISTTGRAEGGSEDQHQETGLDGTFSFEGVFPGNYSVTVVGIGYKKFSTSEVLVEGEHRDLIYRLETQESDFEVVVRAKREKPAREVTRQTVTQKEITKIPGTGGDALRAVQNLPGVGLANFMGGELVIRGSSHGDSVYFFNSVGTSMLYHFGGMTSILNSDLLASIDYYPGNYSVKYGRATGGVINVNTQTPNTEKFHGYIDVDAFDGGLLLEGPLSENWSLAVSGRRSWIDAIIQGADLFGDNLQMTVAPRYYDFQVIADYHPDSKDHVKLLLYGSDDRWVMDWDDEPNWDGGLDLHLWTYGLQAEWAHRFDKKWSNELNIGIGNFGVIDNEGEMELKWGAFPLTIRDEVAWTPNKKLALRMGTDSVLTWGYLKAHVPGDMTIEGEQYTATEVPWIDMDGNRFYFYPALYSELEIKAIPKTEIVAGIRADYYSSINASTLDPRLSARYKLFDKTTLKGGVGIFHQVPEFTFVDKEYGNPNLDPIRAVHYSLGVEQDLHKNVSLNVEGFYKDLTHMMTGSDEMVRRDGELVSERYDSDGEGRVYGAELLLKHKSTDRFFGWVSYTLMKSERKDDVGEPWRLFDADQTHLLTALASLNLGRGFTIGMRFRLASGKPKDKITGSGFDVDRNEYYPVYSGNNTLRTPMFHQLDVRIDKKWQWDPLALTVYLDIQNVYNRKNPVIAIDSYDFSETGYAYDLPIIPSLGLKLEI